jgi:CRISPR/Cas system CSM-associated protein Csm3 (group 7 of RAMP superfamily)
MAEKAEGAKTADQTKLPLWSGEQSRRIKKRIVVEGTLVLETPAHFGNGDEAGSLLPLTVDEVSNQPILTGASIAGALRSYVWSRESGYGKAETDDSNVIKLFGGRRQDDGGFQSTLIVDDSRADNAEIELRDGVKINPASRTAEDGKLYTFVVWAAGTKFPLRFELIITDGDDEDTLRQLLATALHGLQSGEITLGARKGRGYGRVTVNDWRVKKFDLRQPQGLGEWLKCGGEPLKNEKAETDIVAALTASLSDDKRQCFSIDAMFDLDGSLLIRAESEVADMGHLRSNGQPILSGTSLGGAIRARALKIANTLGIENAQAIINQMFGEFGENATGQRAASRVTVEEHPITGGQKERWVQARVSIDRFTGGALDTALFDQQPQFGGSVRIKMVLRLTDPDAQKHEIGLLLLILKDLWTGDLPLGGESSVGRGRLRGKSATLTAGALEWTLTTDGDSRERLVFKGADKELLNVYVDALVNKVPTGGQSESRD